MIVADTSVWVDYFNGKINAGTDMLHTCLGEEDVLMGDLILAEVLQGFREDRLFKHALQLLQAFPLVSMLGPDMAIQSARHYRTLRQNGVTVRKTIDVMIGTYCIAEGLPLLYTDRDFTPMIRHLGLSPAI